MREASNITDAAGAGVLFTLRAIATVPHEYLSDTWKLTEMQAHAFRDLLPNPDAWLPATITDFIPNIAVELIDSIPVAGTAFWGNGRWNIHLRAADATDQQQHTLLHEFKHIIDHPIRTSPNALTFADWEALADHFADVVLSGQGSAKEPTSADVAAA